MRASLRALLMGACLTLAPMGAGAVLAAPSAAVRAPVVATTQHVGTFNGQKVAYKAIVAETFLTDGAGAPTGRGSIPPLIPGTPSSPVMTPQ